MRQKQILCNVMSQAKAYLIYYQLFEIGKNRSSRILVINCYINKYKGFGRKNKEFLEVVKN